MDKRRDYIIPWREKRGLGEWEMGSCSCSREWWEGRAPKRPQLERGMRDE